MEPSCMLAGPGCAHDVGGSASLHSSLRRTYGQRGHWDGVCFGSLSQEGRDNFISGKLRI